MMTPRRETVALFLHDSREEIRRKITKSRQSCFVVCEGTMENVLGVVHVLDIVKKTGKRLCYEVVDMDGLRVDEVVVASIDRTMKRSVHPLN